MINFHFLWRKFLKLQTIIRVIEKLIFRDCQTANYSTSTYFPLTCWLSLFFCGKMKNKLTKSYTERNVNVWNIIIIFLASFPSRIRSAPSCLESHNSISSRFYEHTIGDFYSRATICLVHKEMKEKTKALDEKLLRLLLTNISGVGFSSNIRHRSAETDGLLYEVQSHTQFSWWKWGPYVNIGPLRLFSFALKGCCCFFSTSVGSLQTGQRILYDDAPNIDVVGRQKGLITQGAFILLTPVSEP